tara:strand:+ start:156 stop:422 length:267 start_codon:yes stop_codon:yes gene_type:complete
MARIQNFHRIKITTSNDAAKDIILQEKEGKLYVDDSEVLTIESIDSSVLTTTNDGDTTVLMLSNLPTSDPNTIGQLWNNNGVIAVSNG